MIGLRDLEGRWHLTRKITDRRAGLSGLLDGVSVWRPDNDGLIQHETGVLRYGDAPPMQASRVYLWRAEAGALVVLFEDGRPFHRLGPGAAHDTHLCAPDTYVVTYDFADWPVWDQTWEVTGPHKDLRLHSRFRPA